jgi:amino acid permease
MMLIKEIWTPLFYFIIPSLRRWTENSRQRENIASDYFLLLFLVSLFPLLLKDDLLSLRHANYASFIALIVLVVSMADKVFRTSYETIDIHKINWYSTDISDWVYAFPIVGISFYCMSNLLPVYERLIDPTQERVDFVLNASVGGCAM